MGIPLRRIIMRRLVWDHALVDRDQAVGNELTNYSFFDLARFNFCDAANV